MFGLQSTSLPVDMGVKQDCGLDSIIFNVFLVAITLVSHREHQHSGSVCAKYRIGDSLLNLWRFQIKTKTSSELTFALQYADDAAFPSLTADVLPRSLDIIPETYLRAGLVVNTTKT